jgi:hypothetical protein
VLFSEYYDSDQVKEDEIGACSTHETGEMHTKFQSRNLKGSEDHLGEQAKRGG